MKLKMIESAASLTEADIVHAEEDMGRSIPASYRTFLLAHNGGYPETSDFKMRDHEGKIQLGTIDWFLGINVQKSTNIEHFLEIYHGRIPDDLFPIARDPGGNLILLLSEGKDQGKVYFWDHEFEAEEGEKPTYANVYLVADSFEEFLKTLGEHADAG